MTYEHTSGKLRREARLDRRGARGEKGESDEGREGGRERAKAGAPA